jgi:hypothetical protein
MKNRRRIAVSVTAVVVGLTGLACVGGASAQATSPGVCTLEGYHNPVLDRDEDPGVFRWIVPNHDLVYGVDEYCVKGLQQMLNYRYHNVLTVDGKFGPNTRTYVRRFQSEYTWCTGPVDGRAGPRTVSCLEYAGGVTIW